MEKIISVVIPNWNGKHFLKNCFESLEKQTFKKFEIIVVDNGSTDGSVDFIKKNFLNIRIIEFDKNRGFAAAVNVGIKKADGEFIFLLNNDTEVEPKCLENLYLSAKTSYASAFSCKMLYFDERKMICDASDGYSIYGYAFQRGNRKIDYGQFDTNTNIFSACAGAALYRKNLFDKIGFFDEDFFAYLEDIDIGFRTLLNGEKCEYVPSAIIYHIDGGTSKKLNNFAAYYSYRNNLYLLAKNMPFCLLILFFPFIFSYQIRNLLISIKERNFKIFTKSYKDFFINFPEIFNKRKLIQKNKKISNYALYKILSKKYPFQIIKTCFNLTKKIIKYLLKLFFKIEFSEKKILYGKSSNSNSKL